MSVKPDPSGLRNNRKKDAGNGKPRRQLQHPLPPRSRSALLQSAAGQEQSSFVGFDGLTAESTLLFPW